MSQTVVIVVLVEVYQTDVIVVLVEVSQTVVIVVVVEVPPHVVSPAGAGPLLQQVRLLPPGGSYLSSRLLSGKQKYFIEYILYCILLFINQ